MEVSVFTTIGVGVGTSVGVGVALIFAGVEGVVPAGVPVAVTGAVGDGVFSEASEVSPQPPIQSGMPRKHKSRKCTLVEIRLLIVVLLSLKYRNASDAR